MEEWYSEKIFQELDEKNVKKLKEKLKFVTHLVHILNYNYAS